MNQQNRAARRATATTAVRRNGTAAAAVGVKAGVGPQRNLPVFSRAEEEVRLGDNVFHLAVLTNYGVRLAQEYIEQFPNRCLDGTRTLPGEQMVDGSLRARDFGPLFGLFEFAIAESDRNQGKDDPDMRGTFTEDDLWAADGEQLRYVANRFWEHSGLSFVAELVKNSAAAVQEALTTLVGRLTPEAIVAMQGAAEAPATESTTETTTGSDDSSAS